MRYGRASQLKDGNIIVPLWLIFDARGNVRMTRGEPDVQRSERAMRMTVTVPQALFRMPTISASLTIEAPTTAVPEIDVVAAAEALRSVVGCDIDVRIASGIEARSDETPQAAQPEGQEPGPKGDAQPSGRKARGEEQSL